MLSKFNTQNFEPVHLKKAKYVLQKHLEVLEVQKESRKRVKKEPVKLSLWQKFLNFIKLG